ncbi:MAG: helix-turn-helix domain-containing protein [Lachnospiraceae bacterium]|jgi:two-component system response regulator YesN|nr:helix-turn-helix domain-containing protein [Lachnospiraceae bacterium]
MLSVLIADDEWIEREGISLLLEESPWEFRVYMAENGEEAADILKKQDIDILFTDIKMPFMDGLELLVVANQSCKGLKVVIFSAFADFAYAKTALENRVFHYFLKPVDPDEFQRVLEELVKLITKEREENRRAFRMEEGSVGELFAFLKGGEEAPEELRRLFDGNMSCRLWMVNIAYEKEMAIAQFYEKIREEERAFIYREEVSEEILLLVSKGEEGEEEAFRSLLEICGILRACVILSGEIREEKSFVENYLRMEGMLGFHFYTEGNQLFHVEEERKDSEKPEMIIELIMREINYGAENNNFQYVLENLTLLQEEMRRHIGNSHIYVKYLYANIMRKLLENRDITGADFKASLERLFQESSLSGVHEMITGLVRQLMESVNADAGEGIEQKRVIRTVLAIIDERYREDISLQSIAEEVYLSPSYLSYLFKKEVGVSLIKYITMLRLGKAKELLLAGNMKVSDIAVKVGYQNYSYFNIMFKNHVGVSPAQYRERNG